MTRIVNISLVSSWPSSRVEPAITFTTNQYYFFVSCVQLKVSQIIRSLQAFILVIIFYEFQLYWCIILYWCITLYFYDHIVLMDLIVLMYHIVLMCFFEGTGDHTLVYKPSWQQHMSEVPRFNLSQPAGKPERPHRKWQSTAIRRWRQTIRFNVNLL